MTVVESARALPEGTTNEVMRRLFPPAAAPSLFMTDPDGWARERLGVESWSVPRRIRESVRDNRHTAVHACHESAKTHTAASIAAWWLDIHPVGESFVATSAPTNDQVRALLWRDMQAMHVDAGLRGRITSNARWLIDERLVAFGRKTANLTNPAEAMQSFQGIHARYPLVIIDEAGGVPEWLFHAADSIAANENGRVLAIGNPDDPASYFAQICKPGSKYNVIGISAYDTPAFTGERVSERLLELLIGPTYVEEMRELGEESPYWLSKVLGQFPPTAVDTVVPIGALEAARARTIAPGPDPVVIGVDVARFGSDDTVISVRRGNHVRLAKRLSGADTMQTVGETLEIARATGHPASLLRIVVDDTGVGGGVTDRLREVSYCQVVPFNAADAPWTPDYPNRRSELWFTFAERLGEIDLDDDRRLAADLIAPKYKLDSRGRRVVEPKAETKKRLGRSPDAADSVLLCFATPDHLVTSVAAAPRVFETELGPRTGSLTGDLMEDNKW